MASASADAEQRGDGPATLIDVDDKTGLAVRAFPSRIDQPTTIRWVLMQQFCGRTVGTSAGERMSPALLAKYLLVPHSVGFEVAQKSWKSPARAEWNFPRFWLSILGRCPLHSKGAGPDPTATFNSIFRTGI